MFKSTSVVPQLKEEKNEKDHHTTARYVFLCLNEFARSC